MKVFLSVASFDAAYGGPAVSVSQLGFALANSGVDVGLWAPDGSALVSKVVPTHARLQPLAGGAADAIARFGRPDIIHDNGIWLQHNHRLSVLAQRENIPRVVSLRGMLEPWALNHKHWKKKLAWGLYQKRDLATARLFHATADAEAANASRMRLNVPLCVIPNGVDVYETTANSVPFGVHAGLTAGRKVALFVGRIYPVKGLPMLIRAWAVVRPRDWVLRIVGPNEAGHREELEKLVRSLNLADVINFDGPVVSAEKHAVYRSADLFVLPTHSENFGLVVAEALSHGVPVLTTKGAPWSKLREKQCGWWTEPTVDGITQALMEAVGCDKDRLRAMGANGRAWMDEEFAWQNISHKFTNAYESLLRNQSHS